MTEHLPIQDPDDWPPELLMDMAEALFAPLTPVSELERICMTLAHLPTEDAQRLLARFKASPRAAEVSWLECAIDEGACLLLEPTNELEEREFLTLKVIEDLEYETADLDGELSVAQLSLDKADIRLGALRALVETGRAPPAAAEALLADIADTGRRRDALLADIAQHEAMIEHLRASITTPRYRRADPDVLRHIHFDGE
ncbi:hypothetical protein [Thiohalocapsa sp. ML1]|jgi:hypothetical protein|uniref:hypothetical protein n=1 Tax=Thiohalocapsa sp. ML1 TaxID=1431688 RepID=UPI000731FF80|nr:hypothetical protein [Thiohalocapsa sp. ML1]